MTLKHELLTIAASLPNGDPTRRELLAALKNAETFTLYALVIGDGYLYGADERGNSERYWSHATRGEDEWAIYKLTRVPEELADQLVRQGDRNQHFSDGYIAWDAAKPYVQDVMDYHEDLDEGHLKILHGVRVASERYNVAVDWPLLEIPRKGTYKVTFYDKHKGKAEGRTTDEYGWGRIQKLTKTGKPTGKEIEARFRKGNKIGIAFKPGNYMTHTYSEVRD